MYIIVSEVFQPYRKGYTGIWECTNKNTKMQKKITAPAVYKNISYQIRRFYELSPEMSIPLVYLTNKSYAHFQ